VLRVGPAVADDAFRPLRTVAAEHGLSFGFAVDPAPLANDPAYQDIVAKQAGIVVPENALKWAQDGDNSSDGRNGTPRRSAIACIGAWFTMES